MNAKERLSGVDVVVQSKDAFQEERFYSKRFLLGAIASEAAGLRTTFSSWLIDNHMISQDVHVLCGFCNMTWRLVLQGVSSLRKE